MAARKTQKDTVPTELIGMGLIVFLLGVGFTVLVTSTIFEGEQKEEPTKIQLEELLWTASTNDPSTCTLRVEEGQEVYHCKAFATIDSLTFGALKLTREGGIEWTDGTQVQEIDYAAERFMEHARERAQEQGLCEEAKETEDPVMTFSPHGSIQIF